MSERLPVTATFIGTNIGMLNIVQCRDMDMLEKKVCGQEHEQAVRVKLHSSSFTRASL
jgi:hypothetical protein